MFLKNKKNGKNYQYFAKNHIFLSEDRMIRSNLRIKFIGNYIMKI